MVAKTLCENIIRWIVVGEWVAFPPIVFADEREKVGNDVQFPPNVLGRDAAFVFHEEGRKVSRCEKVGRVMRFASAQLGRFK